MSRFYILIIIGDKFLSITQERLWFDESYKGHRGEIVCWEEAARTKDWGHRRIST